MQLKTSEIEREQTRDEGGEAKLHQSEHNSAFLHQIQGWKRAPKVFYEVTRKTDVKLIPITPGRRLRHKMCLYENLSKMAATHLSARILM